MDNEVKNLCQSIENRISQIFDKIQENPDNLKIDYLLLDYFNILEKIISIESDLSNE